MKKTRVASAFLGDEPIEEPYEAEHNTVSPTGWIYDRDIRKWVPPEHLVKESHKKWKWDPDKKIWIDLEKEQRLERHRQWRQTQGKPPTFEEWKAQKQKEEAKAALSSKTETD